MDIIIFFVVMLFCFAVLTATFPKLGEDILYTLAIGGAINSNIFNVETYGFDLWGIRFGIDSILYSIFVFCVILSYIKYGKKKALKLTIYTILGIVFSAVIMFFGMWLSYGTYEKATMWSLLSFGASAIGSLVAIYVMIIVAEKLKAIKKDKANNYFFIFVMFVIATVLNTLIFYGIVALFGGVSTGAGWVILGNAIGKFICLALCLLSYFLIGVIEEAIINNKENEQSKN